MITLRLTYIFLHALLLVIVSGASNSFAQDGITKTECDKTSIPEDLKNTKTLVDSIVINIHPVFDENNPDENNWAFRLVNKLHSDTHQDVIKNDLQFREGDSIDQKALEESERLLRTRRYLNSAYVTSQIDCQNKQTVSVDVREVWTLIPDVSYSNTGGKSSYGFGLHDSNFLGLGKSVNISRNVEVERTSDLIEYYDPNTGFKNTRLSAIYANNSDGKVQAFNLAKPFIALDTEWASGISYQQLNEENTLYKNGKEANRFGHDNESKTVYYGIKINNGSRDSIHRVSVGYTEWNDQFTSVGIAPNISSIVPTHRQYNYPWAEYEHIYDGFVEAKNIQQINRIEDINLGSHIRARIGYTSSQYSNNDENIVFEMEFSQGIAISKKQLLLTKITASGFEQSGDIYNGRIKTDISYHWQNFNKAQFYLNLINENGTRLFQDLPLELGGDTGLRGYPIRYVAGDHLQLVTVEQRYFGEREWFSLFHMGAAIFYDQGRVIGESAIAQDHQGWLRDVGIGLRISGTRTGNAEEGAHNVLHIDVASPLDGSKDTSKWQLLVKVKKSF